MPASAMQVAVNVVGIALMIGTALLLQWFKTRPAGRPRPPPSPHLRSDAMIRALPFLSGLVVCRFACAAGAGRAGRGGSTPRLPRAAAS